MRLKVCSSRLSNQFRTDLEPYGTNDITVFYVLNYIGELIGSRYSTVMEQTLRHILCNRRYSQSFDVVGKILGHFVQTFSGTVSSGLIAQAQPGAPDVVGKIVEVVAPSPGTQGCYQQARDDEDATGRLRDVLHFQPGWSGQPRAEINGGEKKTQKRIRSHWPRRSGSHGV